VHCFPNLVSSEARPPIQQILICEDLTSLTMVEHERTPFNEENDAVITQNPDHAVRSESCAHAATIEKS
jgi:hypothetical protein